MGYEYLDEITSDQMFRAFGKTTQEVFINAAKAMFGVMYDLDDVTIEEEVDVEAQGPDEERLLYDWLSNLLIEFEVVGVFFADFSIDSIERTADGELFLKGKAKGSASPRQIRTQVKGVTFHRFALERINNKLIATVVVDV